MSECPEHKWMGRVKGSNGPCPHCGHHEEILISQSEAQEIVKRALLADLMGEAPISTVGSIRSWNETMYSRVCEHLQRRYADEAIKRASEERAFRMNEHDLDDALEQARYASEAEGPLGTGGFDPVDTVGDSVGHREAQAKARAVGLEHHRAVLGRAWDLYRHRGAERGEVWKRSGVRGQVFHLMAKAERAFQQCEAGQVPNVDHFIDMVNYAVFAIRLIETAGEGHDTWSDHLTLNGEWPWAS